jgi:hypothetical protein
MWARRFIVIAISPRDTDIVRAEVGCGNSHLREVRNKSQVKNGRVGTRQRTSLPILLNRMNL